MEVICLNSLAHNKKMGGTLGIWGLRNQFEGFGVDYFGLFFFLVEMTSNTEQNKMV